VSSGSVTGAFLSAMPRNRLSELQSGRIAFGIAPVPGAMHSRCPVLCGCQIDRLRIQAILPDAGLGELKRVGIVRRDGTFNDYRALLWRQIITLGRFLTAVCSGGCRNVLPDIGECRFV